MKKIFTYTKIYLLSFALILVLCSCSIHINKPSQSHHDKDHSSSFIATLEQHLNAVSNKDIKALASTLPPDGAMQLILPQTEIIDTVEGFLDYHRQWFAIDNGWTFETTILNSTIGETLGMAIVEIIYKEPLRNGKPYFNRMAVSYDLEKIDGQWYIIKDHASSIEKSTDKKAE